MDAKRYSSTEFEFQKIAIFFQVESGDGVLCGISKGIGRGISKRPLTRNYICTVSFRFRISNKSKSRQILSRKSGQEKDTTGTGGCTRGDLGSCPRLLDRALASAGFSSPSVPPGKRGGTE